MSSRKSEWRLNSVKTWVCTDRLTPIWSAKEKITSNTTNNLVLTYETSQLIIKNNNEAIEVIAIPVPGQRGSLVATVGDTRDSVALFSEDEAQDRNMGLKFAATSNHQFSAIMNCETFVAHLRTFIPVKYAERGCPQATETLEHVYQELMRGIASSDAFPAGQFLPPEFPVSEAFAAVIADPRFPETMAIIHDRIEGLLLPE